MDETENTLFKIQIDRFHDDIINIKTENKEQAHQLDQLKNECSQIKGGLQVFVFCVTLFGSVIAFFANRQINEYQQIHDSRTQQIDQLINQITKFDERISILEANVQNGRQTIKN